jgi:hypothetical protein
MRLVESAAPINALKRNVEIKHKHARRVWRQIQSGAKARRSKTLPRRTKLIEPPPGFGVRAACRRFGFGAGIFKTQNFT